MKLEITSKSQLDSLIAKNFDFSKVTYFRADNLPGVTALPDLPACAYFWADARLTALRGRP